MAKVYMGTTEMTPAVVIGNSTVNLPQHPTTPGSYMLICTINEDGVASYSWESVA